MISSKVLGQVQFICQKVRSSSVLFGNLQVILAGDFLQLPPVANACIFLIHLQQFVFLCNYVNPRQYFWKKDEHNFPSFSRDLDKEFIKIVLELGTSTKTSD
jgi:hypothetical protein